MISPIVNYTVINKRSWCFISKSITHETIIFVLKMNISLKHILPENSYEPKTYKFKVSEFKEKIKTVEWLKYNNIYIELENDVLNEFVDMTEKEMKLFDEVYNIVLTPQDNSYVCTDMILERTDKTDVYYNVITQDLYVWDDKRYENVYKHFEMKRILFHSDKCKNVLEWFKCAYDCIPIPEAFCFVIPKTLHFQIVPSHKIKDWFNDSQMNRVNQHNKIFCNVREEQINENFEEYGYIETRLIYSLLKIYLKRRDKTIFKTMCSVLPTSRLTLCKEYIVKDNIEDDEEVDLLLHPAYRRMWNEYIKLEHERIWGNIPKK